jgi:hypothetical protein
MLDVLIAEWLKMVGGIFAGTFVWTRGQKTEHTAVVRTRKFAHIVWVVISSLNVTLSVLLWVSL